MIKIDDLIPLLRDGWVAMDEDGGWYWCEHKPEMEYDSYWWIKTGYQCYLSDAFDIEPVEDWKDSLIEIKDGKAVKK